MNLQRQDDIVKGKAISSSKQYLYFYFALTFLLSWGSLLLYAESLPAATSQTEHDLPVIVFATAGGPSISGLILNYILAMKNQSRRNQKSVSQIFRQRYCQRFDFIRWFPFMVLVAPMTIGLLLLILSDVGGDEFKSEIWRTSDPTQLIIMGASYGAVAGLFEEVGWTGFAVPEMLENGYTVETTGLIIGLIWGLWHMLVALWGSGDEDGNFDFDLFVPWIPWNFLVLPFYRILMVYVYTRTKSYISMAMMHGILTASLPIILMPNVLGVKLVGFYTLFAAALMLVIVMLKRANGGAQLSLNTSLQTKKD